MTSQLHATNAEERAAGHRKQTRAYIAALQEHLEYLDKSLARVEEGGGGPGSDAVNAELLKGVMEQTFAVCYEAARCNGAILVRGKSLSD